jgi:hypothetical protein
MLNSLQETFMSKQDKPSTDESRKTNAGKDGKNSGQHQHVNLNEKPEAAEADTQSEFTKAEELRNRQ